VARFQGGWIGVADELAQVPEQAHEHVLSEQIRVQAQVPQADVNGVVVVFFRFDPRVVHRLHPGRIPERPRDRSST
jgi:hypothetical protein